MNLISWLKKEKEAILNIIGMRGTVESLDIGNSPKYQTDIFFMIVDKVEIKWESANALYFLPDS